MSREDHIRRRAAALGYDRTIRGTGVLPSDLHDLYALGMINREDLVLRLERLGAPIPTDA